MITNEVQFRNTKNWLARFESSKTELEEAYPLPSRTRMQQLHNDAAAAQANDLLSELNEYEMTRSGSIRTFQSETLNGLADALIKARIARGWTQKQLAEKLESEWASVLIDDRDAGFGQKAGDADLFGIPTRIILSDKMLEKGWYELKKRKDKEASIISYAF